MTSPDAGDDNPTPRLGAERALRFLADASARLASSLDYDATIAAVGDLAIPTLAARYALHLLDDDGRLQLVAALGNPPRPRRDGTPAPPVVVPQALGGVATVLRTGRPEVEAEAAPEVVRGLVADVGSPGREPRGATVSALHLPLQTGGRTFGVLTLVAEPGRRYDSSDVELAADFAHRAASAIQNALLYRAVQRSVRARDEFLAAAAHDLRNPLAVISGHVQLLRRHVMRMEPAPDERMLDGLQRIGATVQSMVVLLDEMLDLTRIQMGRPLDLDRRPTDLAALARRVAASYQQTATGHRIRVEATDEPVTGLFDEARLERVVGNLLNNAVKYSPMGGDVVVAVSREEGAGGPVGVLEVRDQGLGIPADDLPHVFERFYRARNVAGLIHGVGIGLAGSRQIVEQHGGTLSVESTEGEGSTFTILLSLSPNPSPRRRGERRGDAALPPGAVEDPRLPSPKR